MTIFEKYQKSIILFLLAPPPLAIIISYFFPSMSLVITVTFIILVIGHFLLEGIKIYLKESDIERANVSTVYEAREINFPNFIKSTIKFVIISIFLLPVMFVHALYFNKLNIINSAFLSLTFLVYFLSIIILVSFYQKIIIKKYKYTNSRAKLFISILLAIYLPTFLMPYFNI